MENIKILEKFVEEDNIDLLRVLVRNSNDEIAERYSFNQNLNLVLEPDDKEILAISEKNFFFESDTCDNCCEDDICSENQIIDCAVDLIISERNDGFYERILREFKANFA